MAARTGLPVTTAFLPIASAASPGKPKAIFFAGSFSALLLRSSEASALTSSSGRRCSQAIQPPGKQT